jgi:hypothetical protein
MEKLHNEKLQNILFAKKMSAKKIEEICPNLMENNTHNQWITVIREKSVKVILLCVMRIN